MDMDGKICIVTGANSGIGKETALGLANSGAHVVISARNRIRGEDAKADIIKQSGNRNVELMLADLTTSQGIRELAGQFLSRHDKLHLLINNAGGLFKNNQKNDEGMELTFALNYYAPFFLTQLLLGILKRSAPARIINVASETQAEKLDIENLIDPVHYDAMKVYGTAKLAIVMFTYALASKLSGTGVTVNAVHPGVIYTPQSARMAPSFIRPLLKLFMSSPEKGAQPSLRLAEDPSLEDITGQYFNKFTNKKTVPFSYDKQQQETLYEQSLLWSGLK